MNHFESVDQSCGCWKTRWKGEEQKIKQFEKHDRPFEKFAEAWHIQLHLEALRSVVEICCIRVFDLCDTDTTESVFQRCKVIQKHGIYPLTRWRVSETVVQIERFQERRSEERRHRGGGRRRERKLNGWRRKLEKLKKKGGEKKKVNQLSFARPFPRAIDLADRVANLDSYTTRKDPIVDRATTWLRVFPHRTKML